MNQGNKGKKVFVGLSGGVDSAVSAALLKKQGYDVYGVFMKNFSGVDFGIEDKCPWKEDQESAMQVAEYLNIPFRTYNFEKQYRAQVVDYFIEEFAKGRTPNPDVMCNKTIKFDVFLERALRDGADYIATGHYARKARLSQLETDELNYKVGSATVESLKDLGIPEQSNLLIKGLDPNKDQTYFLHTFTQQQLKHVLFPIGNMHKPDVRKVAADLGLPNADRPDSQGICFIGEIDLIEFLKSQIPVDKGEIRDIDTEEVIGEHDGVAFYTIGQRKGLELSGFGVPYFVAAKDVEKNIIYAAKGSRHPKLFRTEVNLETLHLINNFDNTGLDNLPISAAIRYRQQPQPGIFESINPKNSSHKDIIATFQFEEPQRAITEGQSLVAYIGEVCLGGGVISSQAK